MDSVGMLVIRRFMRRAYCWTSAALIVVFALEVPTPEADQGAFKINNLAAGRTLLTNTPCALQGVGDPSATETEEAVAG